MFDDTFKITASDKRKIEELVSEHHSLFCGAYCNLYSVNMFPQILYFKSGIFNASSCYSGYVDNDPMLCTFTIKKIGDDEYTVYGGVDISLEVNDYEYKPCKFRKTTGDMPKVLGAISKWQKKRLKLVLENKENIRGFDKSNLRNL